MNLSQKVFTCSNLKLLEYTSIWIKDIYTIHQNSSLDFLIHFCQIWQRGRVVKLWSSFWHVVVGFWNDLMKIGRTSFLSSFLCSFLCTYIFPFFISFSLFVRPLNVVLASSHWNQTIWLQMKWIFVNRGHGFGD